MNEIQYARNNLVVGMKGYVHQLEHQLIEARQWQAQAEDALQQAIDDDPESWHATPGILK